MSSLASIRPAFGPKVSLLLIRQQAESRTIAVMKRLAPQQFAVAVHAQLGPDWRHDRASFDGMAASVERPQDMFWKRGGSAGFREFDGHQRKDCNRDAEGRPIFGRFATTQSH
jgi:hypothetical protein